MTNLEIIAAILGAISVWLVVLRNVWAFPIGIVMVIMYFWIFYEAKLYSDMLLQVFFFVLQIQGWLDWSRSQKGADEKIVVRQLSQRQWLLTGGILVVGTVVLGYIVKAIFPDAALPWLDAFAAVVSMLAQWWMNRRYLDNWTLWIAVDALYLYIYYSKGLYPTFVLYGIFLAMAIAGYFEWKKKLVNEVHANTSNLD